MPQEKYCYFHKETPTGLSCVSCGKSICPECMKEAAVGFKCPNCAQVNKTHIEHITTKNYITGTFTGLVIGTGVGYIWHQLSIYGALISLAIAYAVGFCISKAISASIGNKIGLKIQVMTGLITVISLIYNPIIIIAYLSSGIFPSVFSVIFAMSLWCSSCIIKLLAVIIAVWAAVRHFKI